MFRMFRQTLHDYLFIFWWRGLGGAWRGRLFGAIVLRTTHTEFEGGRYQRTHLGCRASTQRTCDAIVLAGAPRTRSSRGDASSGHTAGSGFNSEDL